MDYQWQANEIRAAATRAQILRAVVGCLHDRGFAALTNASITRSANVSCGAIGHHFPTRQALLVAAIDFASDRLSEFRLTKLEKLSCRLTRFRAVIDLAWATSRMPEGIAINEIRSCARSHADLATALSPRLTTIASDYEAFVARLAREAGITPTADIQILASTTAMAMHALAFDRFANQNSRLVTGVLGALRAMCEDIIVRQLGETRRIDGPPDTFPAGQHLDDVSLSVIA